MTDQLPTIEANTWLLTTLLMTTISLVPGLTWSWLFTFPDEGHCRWRGRITRLTMIIITSLAAATLASFVLGSTGRLSLTNLLGLLAAFSVAGVLMGRQKLPHILDNLCSIMPGIILLMTGIIVIMFVPQRGEWIMGGWDPGIYINQGVHIAQTGSFHNAPLPWHSFMSPDDFLLFTRGESIYREIAPGVPFDRQLGVIQPYFFRLLPSLVALLDLCGGLRAATRVSDFMALFSVITFAGMLTNWGLGFRFVILSTALLAIQPLWLYHAHIPTTEMLQLVLVCGIGFLIPQRRGTNALLTGVLLFAAILNRFDFVPLSALLIAAIAVLDFDRTDRWSVLRERALQFAGLAAGATADWMLCGVTFSRIGFIVPLLLAATVALSAAAIVIDLLASNAKCRASVLRLQTCWRIAPIICFALGVMAVALVQKFPIAQTPTPSPIYLRPFFGFPFLIAAALGAIAFLLSNRVTKEAKIFTLYLLAVSVALLVEGLIAPTYPWSTRRFVPFLVPALVVLAGAALAAVTGTKNKRMGFVIATALLLALVWFQRTPIRQAVRSTEYDGASRALSEVAAHINPTDVVIADHHWWSTPLTFIYDRPALNGGLLLGRAAPTNAVTLALQSIQRWQSAGKQVVFLTSTRDGLGIYKQPIGKTSLEWTSEPITLREVIHSKNASGFEMKSRTFVFQLHRVLPD